MITKTDESIKKILEIEYLHLKLDEKEKLINKIAGHPFLREDILDMIRDAAKIE